MILDQLMLNQCYVVPVQLPDPCFSVIYDHNVGILMVD